MSTAQLIADVTKLNKEEVAQALVNIKHKTKKLEDQFKTVTKSFLELMTGQENKTVKVTDGQVTVRSKENEEWVSNEVLEAWLKKRRKYTEYSAKFVDYSLITPEFLEEHGLLDLVSYTDVDKDRLKEDFSRDDLKEVLTFSTTETIAVTLTKKKEVK